ncbi:Lcl C-terminal domain-containing protein [Thermophagus sp. OGC60D27]|uniref:Lcl C-terminal domain-containing protein n=1 Tax=Thermophagus sp. OGC60D27 TaxID=3458415 RepID=UPI0040379809
MRRQILSFSMVLWGCLMPAEAQTTEAIGQYPIVDTGQKKCYNNQTEITAPVKGEAFYGQDAQFDGLQPSYTDNGDGTITDNVTGLMWQKGFEVMTYAEAVEKVRSFNQANYTDWRIPTIKEAYSLILFSGVDVSARDMSKLPPLAIPFIDTNYFDFEYGANGDRVIDTQMLSSTLYTGKTMGRNTTVFGVNFADGRIKGYPVTSPRGDKMFTVRFVRGNHDFGKNNFVDNGDATISDVATGLMWTKEDSRKGMNWEEALAWVQQMNEQNYLGYSDWRLPNAKELHSLVDYSVSQRVDSQPAINPVFEVTKIKDEGNGDNVPFYWTSTTHVGQRGGRNAVYFCFGEAMGFMKTRRNNNVQLMDVHGAGAQRSDPKAGNPDDFPQGHGPQGDVIRIYNFVRMVRDIK